MGLARSCFARTQTWLQAGKYVKALVSDLPSRNGWTIGEQAGSVMVEYRYTAHQVARGSRPDAVSGNTWYLVKAASLVRLSYQVRLLTFMAAERGARLVIRVPESSRAFADLRAFARAGPGA